MTIIPTVRPPRNEAAGGTAGERPSSACSSWRQRAALPGMPRLSRSAKVRSASGDLLLRWSIAAAVVCFLAGCSSAPKLTAEDRREDIRFLAQWAKEYSPFVELNESLKGLPDFEAMAPRYMQLAAEATTDTEFYQVVYGYFSLLGVSGHGHLLSEESLRGYWYEARRQPGQLPRQQLKAGRYWPKLEEAFCFVHPPFRVVFDGEEYYTGQAWRYQDRLIPKGSRILRVNGMPCAAYLSWLRRETWVRHILRDTDWITERLLAVHEGRDFRAWRVVFQLPDETTREALVPWRKGAPAPTEFCDYRSADGNCICLELSDQVGYLRVKSMGGMFIEQDRKKIRTFLQHAGGKYRKLIVDVRHNGGGLLYYGFDNLMAPFLDASLSYTQITGIKRSFLANHEPAYLESLRRGVSIFAHETSVEEIKPPEPWNETGWVFYRVERGVDPAERYDFSGKLFVLMDGATGSAADDYVNTVQRIGIATLVGRPTAGSCAAYLNPVMVRLPASGMIFMLEADLVLNRDGSVNEIVGTKPDIECPPGALPVKATREELLEDRWIKRIMGEP